MDGDLRAAVDGARRREERGDGDARRRVKREGRRGRRPLELLAVEGEADRRDVHAASHAAAALAAAAAERLGASQSSTAPPPGRTTQQSAAHALPAAAVAFVASHVPRAASRDVAMSGCASALPSSPSDSAMSDVDAAPAASRRRFESVSGVPPSIGPDVGRMRCTYGVR